MNFRQGIASLVPMWKYAELFVMLIGLSIFFFTNASSIDEPYSFWRVLAVGLAFDAWAIGLLAWGRLFTFKMKLGDHPELTTLIGATLAGISFSCIAGHLGLLGSDWRWLFAAFLLLGVGLFHTLVKTGSIVKIGPLIKFATQSRLHIFGSIGISFGIFVRFLQAIVPIRHGDPLYYHLLGPQLWVQAGSIQLNEGTPIAMIASYWEYLYLWTQQLWSGGANLISAQLMGQWTHLFWGFGAALVACYVLFQRWTKRSDWALIVVVAIMGISSLQWTANLAKNDWGIIFWTISCLLFGLIGVEKRSVRHIGFSAVLMAIAILGKPASALTIVPIAMVLLFQSSKLNGRNQTLSMMGIYIGIMLLAMLPMMLRNYIMTNNPFFPLLHHIFPSGWISKSYQVYIDDFQPIGINLNPEILVHRFKQVLKESPFVWLLSLIPVLFSHFFHHITRKNLYWHNLLFLTLGPFVLFALLMGEKADIRLFGPGLIFIVAMSTLIACVFSTKMKHLETNALWLLLILLLATSHMPSFMLKKVWSLPNPDQAILEHTAGKAKRWLRKNARKDELIIMIGENEGYYLGQHRIAIWTKRSTFPLGKHETIRVSR